MGLSTPRAASAGEVYADIDHDGIRDVVSIQSIPHTGLVVWLSKSNATLELPTRRPITHVAASDVDGDGRIDLIAADSAAKVHVWHRTVRGHLRLTHPRHAARTYAVSNRGLHRTDEDTSRAAVDDGASTAAIAAPPARLLCPDLFTGVSVAASRQVASRGVPPRDPRGPPAG